LGHNSTFCNLKMQMRKKLYIFKHFAKRKKLFFFQISIILRLIPIKFETLKPPTEPALTICLRRLSLRYQFAYAG
jgi:hypothetical protein